MSARGRSASLALYRGILRAHKGMPLEMQQLGDAYVKSEFKLHKSVKDEAQLDQFFVAWEQYLDNILRTQRQKESLASGTLDLESSDPAFGRNLPSDIELSDEQVQQLEKLKDEASGKSGKQS